MAANPPPTLDLITPGTFPADAPVIEFTLSGSGFVENAVLDIQGLLVGTTFIDGSTLTTSVDPSLFPPDDDLTYDVVVRNPDGQESQPGIIVLEAAITVTWACTPQDVANLLRARTKDKDGQELGEWTPDTRPTLSEVEGIIQLAFAELTSAIGYVVPDTCKRGATSTSALLAAMLVELSYFPEQVRSDRSAYQEYKELYDKQLALLQQCVASGGAGSEVGGEGDTYWSMPVRPETTVLHYERAGGPSWWASARGPWGDLPGDHWPEPENPENWRVWNQPPREPPHPEDLPVGDAPASGEVLPP